MWKLCESRYGVHLSNFVPIDSITDTASQLNLRILVGSQLQRTPIHLRRERQIAKRVENMM